MELQNVRRIAVFKLRSIGDVLMITPVLRALRETFPEARITVVVNAGTEPMLAGNPHLDEVLVYPQSPERVRLGLFRRVALEARFLRELRRRHFDLTIGFTNGDRPAWSSWFSGARYRLGSVHYSRGKYDPQRFIYNLPAPSTPPSMHEVERHFYLLEQAGLRLRQTRPGSLVLVVPEDLRAWARRELEPLRLHGAKVVHVHPVARWLWKCWRNDYMAEVIDWLQTERGARVLLTTGPAPAERRVAQEIHSLCRSKPRFYDGDLSLAQIAALSSQSDIYLGVDTAPMHMAAAVGVPVIALFGPSDPVSWRPWTDAYCILSRHCPCSARGKQACDWSQVRACLAAIPPSDAKDALDRMLFALPQPSISPL